MVAKVTLRVTCDWPGCPREITTQYYPRFWHDSHWSRENDNAINPGRTFCPVHWHRKFKDLDELEETANGVPQL